MGLILYLVRYKYMKYGGEGLFLTFSFWDSMITYRTLWFSFSLFLKSFEHFCIMSSTYHRSWVGKYSINSLWNKGYQGKQRIKGRFCDCSWMASHLVNTWKANFPFLWRRLWKCEGISSLNLSLSLLSLSPQTAVCPQRAKPTRWKVNTLVNLVIAFPHPQSSKPVAWWFLGLNCLILWELCRKKTAKTKPIRRHTNSFPYTDWGK